MPALQSGSVLVGYDAISATTVNYVGGFAFNDLYQPTPAPASPSIWYVNYPKTPIGANLDKFLSGDWYYTDQFDIISMPVRPDNSLGLDYTEGRCIKVLTPDDKVNYSLADDFRPVAGFSNPALVQAQGGISPNQLIFGRSPRPTWCYYFQKADLARQSGDWNTIIALKKEADKAGFEASSAYELFPFIEAYGMRADWGSAQKLTSQAYKLLPKSADGLCLIWRRIGLSAPAGYPAAFQQANTQLNCH